MMADKTTPGGVPVGASVQVGGMRRPVVAPVLRRVHDPGPAAEIPAGHEGQRVGRPVTPLPAHSRPHGSGLAPHHH